MGTHPTGSASKRGKRGGAENRPEGTVRADSGPRLATPEARGKCGEARARAQVIEAIAGILPLPDLPNLLWWVGAIRPPAFRRLEELGCLLADAMEESGNAFAEALSRWIDAIEVAYAKFAATGLVIRARPIWAFWTLFTRPGKPESPLSTLLREEVGYPTDEEAGMGREEPAEGVPIWNSAGYPGPCWLCKRARWWRLRAGGPWVCARCHPPGPPPEQIEFGGEEVDDG